MKITLTLFAGAGILFVTALLAADRPDAKDRQEIEGVWQGFVVEGQGEHPDRGPVQLTEVVITADKVTAKDAKGLSLGDGTYKLDASQIPATIDSTGTNGMARNKTYLGIYELKGDALKWCVTNPGKPRPAKFQTAPGGQFLLVLRRKKT